MLIEDVYKQLDDVNKETPDPLYEVIFNMLCIMAEQQGTIRVLKQMTMKNIYTNAGR